MSLACCVIVCLGSATAARLIAIITIASILLCCLPFFCLLRCCAVGPFSGREMVYREEPRNTTVIAQPGTYAAQPAGYGGHTMAQPTRV